MKAKKNKKLKEFTQVDQQDLVNSVNELTQEHINQMHTFFPGKSFEVILLAIINYLLIFGEKLKCPDHDMDILIRNMRYSRKVTKQMDEEEKRKSKE